MAPASLPRRSFLGGLARLPLVGGAVTLIGQPTASAEPVTADMLEAYKTWLDFEKRSLSWEIAGDPAFADRYQGFGGEQDRMKRFELVDHCFAFVGDSGSYHGGSKSASPYTRAALVLSAVGCDWRRKDR